LFVAVITEAPAVVIAQFFTNQLTVSQLVDLSIGGWINSATSELVDSKIEKKSYLE